MNTIPSAEVIGAHQNKAIEFEMDRINVICDLLDRFGVSPVVVVDAPRPEEKVYKIEPMPSLLNDTYIAQHSDIPNRSKKRKRQKPR